MKIRELLQFVQGTQLESTPSELSFKTSELKKNSIFFALKGNKTNGHDYLNKAVNARAMVVENTEKVPKHYKGAVFKVENTRQALGQVSYFLNKNLLKNICPIGITGTNGKTSISYILEHLLTTMLKKNVGVMGTINHHIGDKIWPTQLTTTDPVSLYKQIKIFKTHNINTLILEVSSHALAQYRVEPFPFELMIFTNLERDHLDYHKNMESYFLEKTKLFSQVSTHFPALPSIAIINADDPYSSRIPITPPIQKITYGSGEHCTFQFEILKQSLNSTSFCIHYKNKTFELVSPLLGLHNVYNAVASIVTALCIELKYYSKSNSTASILEPLEELDFLQQSFLNKKNIFKTFKGIPGRMERIPNHSGAFTFVDYAHTPSGIECVLNLLKPLKEKERSLFILLGCGGDRDPGKRPLMLQAAINGADYVFITSDNPRSEDPLQIIKDMCAGVKTNKEKHFIIPDRKKALNKALSMAQKGDIVLIAGKGHEEFQIIGDKKTPWSDQKITLDILNNHLNKVI